jgi:hypothetical protein
MPTEIHFIGGDKLTVDQEPDEVAKAVATAAPIRLTPRAGSEPVYVNPATIIRWEAVRPLDLKNYRIEQL